MFQVLNWQMTRLTRRLASLLSEGLGLGARKGQYLVRKWRTKTTRSKKKCHGHEAPIPDF
jgi:hypothetical protein